MTFGYGSTAGVYDDKDRRQQGGGPIWGDKIDQTAGPLWGKCPGQHDDTNSQVPRQLQGRWFDISPEGNLWVYVFRANSYDMFEVKPQTNQLVVIDGEPVQLKSGRLNFRNGVLHLIVWHKI